MAKPLISVALITYKHEKYLHAAIKGILSQEGIENYEIVVGDDHSPDRTKEILKEYACGDLHTPGYYYADHVKNMDVLDLPFEENYFDVVLCNHVLEHIIPDNEAMSSIFRALKPGGQALLKVPISLNTQATYEDDSIVDPNEREVAFGQFDHVRVYGQDYEKRLAKVGFDVTRESLSGESERYGLCKDELLYLAKKPSIPSQ
jgi:glycosyltransferase involved in cell wall biosynthesis